MRTNRLVKISPIRAEEYLKNELARKDKMLGANKLDELTDHYTKLYQKPENPINSTYGPIMNTPHAEPSLLLCSRRVKRKSKNETCHIDRMRECTQTCMQLPE